MNDKELLKTAVEAAKYSYSPYSHFAVGAALLCTDRKIYTGCNIENSSYSPTVCAERTAFFKAVSEGVREFEAIAIVGSRDGDFTQPCVPCGVCRQVMAEFCKDNFRIITTGSEYALIELLPEAFKLK